MHNIRQATEQDCALILYFIKRLADYEKLPHEVVATEEIIYKSIFVNHDAHVIFIEEDGNTVGFALYFFNFSTFLGRRGLYLEDLFVIPEKRGCGFGKALLKYLAHIAVENECGRMEWICLNWNEPSIKFYKSLGAFPLDEWTVYRLTGDALSDFANE